MDIRYAIGLEEAEFIIADYLQAKGHKLFANFKDKGKSKYVSYDEDNFLFIAFADNTNQKNITKDKAKKK